MLAFGLAATLARGDQSPNSPEHDYAAEGLQVMQHVQQTFWDPTKSIYTKAPQDRTADYVWRQAAAFSALLGAARHEPATYRPLLDQHFHGLDAYWDAKAPIPGYEPAPTRGNGHDKYYDDNAWLIITFLEAYELTHDRAYVTRAQETARFVLSGSDDKLGGGIWWHASHKDDSKNTCANGPAALGFLYLARVGPPGEAPKWLDAARKTVEWTTAKLQASDGLFDDRIIVTTGEVKRGKLTYNSALMLRSDLGLYRQTGGANYLDEAKRIAKAADFFCDKQTGVFRDPLKWSHFMLEADLDLYSTTHEEYLLHRARTNADAYFAAWKNAPPTDMMSNVATARILFLMAEASLSP
ncbi:MAG TPA: glycoside hydrolase family 76 protein [Candidatus Dormibacteraeota bacterium]|nr:glycoside hydrolase family 76 protein [Candidatus Dormibacteraeota bacterium]